MLYGNLNYERGNISITLQTGLVPESFHAGCSGWIVRRQSG